jgi:integrase
MVKSRYYDVVWVYSVEFPGREIPLVLLADGRPGYVINQWICYLLDEEITPSRLELYIRAICHLYSFVMARYPGDFGPENSERLLADFIEGKKFGTDTYCIKTDDRYAWLTTLGLYWKPLFRRTNTIKSYLDAINQFDQWQVTFHKSKPLNPCEERVMTAWEIYRDFQQRTDWDPLLHLFGSREHAKRDYKTNGYGKYSHRRHELEFHRRKVPRAFPLEKFVDLIEQSNNLRDKLLWLLMGAGSLRGSEVLHLFLTDVEGVDPEHGDAKVILADPEYGMVRWTDKDGKNHYETRAKYFLEQFTNTFFPQNHPLRNLHPRTRYGRRNTRLHAGFKGMTFGDDNAARKLLFSPDHSQAYDDHYLWWMHKIYGQIFSHYFNKYIEKFFWANPSTGQPNPKSWPWHPWLFICTNKNNYGMPLTMPALKQAWQRGLKRIGMEGSGYGLHSLRHMYGVYCANVLKIPIETTQVLMHHASVTSTQTYYRLDSDTIRNMLTQAAIMDKRITTEWKTLISQNHTNESGERHN